MKLKEILRIFTISFVVVGISNTFALAQESTQIDLSDPELYKLVPSESEQNYDHQSPLIMVSLGNDIIGIQTKNTDRYFTNNMNVAIVTDNVSEYFKKLTSRSPHTSYMIMAAQYMYTPKDLESNEVVENDRPYAGWLFIRLQSSDRKQNHLIISGFDAGVVGPLSGAEALQKVVHELTDSKMPQGWNHQLNNELGFNVFHIHAVSMRRDFQYVDNELVGHAGVTLGNVNTHAQVGALYRIGYNMPDDMGASFISSDEIARPGFGNNATPADKGAAIVPSGFSAYIFVGYQSRYVVRDIFLDGNTFSDSHSVEKNSIVNSFNSGLVIGYKGFEVGYSNARVSEQFKTQDGPSNNGSVFLRYTKKTH